MWNEFCPRIIGPTGARGDSAGKLITRLEKLFTIDKSSLFSPYFSSLGWRGKLMKRLYVPLEFMPPFLPPLKKNICWKTRRRQVAWCSAQRRSAFTVTWWTWMEVDWYVLLIWPRSTWRIPLMRWKWRCWVSLWTCQLCKARVCGGVMEVGGVMCTDWAHTRHGTVAPQVYKGQIFILDGRSCWLLFRLMSASCCISLSGAADRHMLQKGSHTQMSRPWASRLGRLWAHLLPEWILIYLVDSLWPM